MKKDSAKTQKIGQYDHKKIEKKWQKIWEEKGTYKTLSAKQAIAKKMKPYYVLDMFPYPSGAGLHVGHPRGYIGSDVFARMKRMQGYNVLHPMGYDAFGLPAEQFAIQNKIHPRKAVEKNVKTFRAQLEKIGFSYDWSRSVNTTDPKYYKWTQWIFLNIYNSYYDNEKTSQFPQGRARPISELVKKFEKQGSDDFTAKEWKGFSPIEQQKILMNYRLAYEGYAEVNWCPAMGTVLANDEIVEKNGKMVSERGEFPVEKKSMRQWFMRITSYADRLLTDSESLDWPQNIKEIQKNWIGKSEGSEITFEITSDQQLGTMTVFTTRADTLFGVTYVVLAPEHSLVSELKSQITNWDKVSCYIEQVKNKSDADRLTVNKEKEGICLEGVFAINPANGERIPVWIADYVLGSYGTGAVMGVPAHDERDFDFAKKYNLPIKEVIIPNRVDIKNPPLAGKETKERQNVQAIIRDPKTDKYLFMFSKEHGWTTFPMGGVESGEDIIESIQREIREETGYINLEFKRILGGPVRAEYYAAHKGENRVSYTHAVMFDLVDHEQVSLLDEEKGKHDFIWLPKSEIIYPRIVHAELNDWLVRWDGIDKPFSESGVLTASEKFNGMDSEQARKEITEFVGGTLVTKYKMRDAIFARQRYWGEPIPLVHDKDGNITEISEKNLPLELPNVTSYEPTGTGESPLATVKSWMKAGYETNTMPGWAGSSWYFLRYIDPNNTKAFASNEELDYWFSKPSSKVKENQTGGIDMYVGGAEHATGHLLYSRFWHKFLFDRGFVKTSEPFKALRNQGMIGGTDGRRMSKRWGNVVNPDDVVEQFGADSLRVFEMFLGPFGSALPWSTEGIIGSRRFIEKIWLLQEKLRNESSSVKSKADTKEQLSYQKILHKTIKKVTDDIHSFSFNTAISSMMILVNEMNKSDYIAVSDFKMFLQILAPFAPHVADELWTLSSLEERVDSAGSRVRSIHLSVWPTYNPKLIIDDTVTMGIQINGKVRSEIELNPDATEAEVKEKVLCIPEIIKWIDGKEIKKFIFIPKKIISIVI